MPSVTEVDGVGRPPAFNGISVTPGAAAFSYPSAVDSRLSAQAKMSGVVPSHFGQTIGLTWEKGAIAELRGHSD